MVGQHWLTDLPERVPDDADNFVVGVFDAGT